MSSIQKIFTGLFLLTFIVLGALFFRSDSMLTESNPQEIVTNQYLVATPHYGPLTQTQEIRVAFDQDQAVGTLSNETAQNIKQNQKVILYDKEGYILPLGGKVESILTNNGKKRITIKLPLGTNTALLATDLDIITLETIASKRLPRSAYIQDNANDKTSTYVWIAKLSTKNKDSANIYTLEKLEIDLGLTVLDYFEESGYKIHSSDLVVLNPDSKIKENIPYSLKVTKLNLPLHNPIKQAWVDFEINRLNKQQAELTERAENCGKAATGNITATSGANSLPQSESCGTDFDGTDPFAIFNSLINRVPQN
jgi:hypothetical protein